MAENPHKCDSRHFHSGTNRQYQIKETIQREPQEGMRHVSYRQPKISLFDLPILLFATVIAAPFVLMLIAPFTNGL